MYGYRFTIIIFATSSLLLNATAHAQRTLAPRFGSNVDVTRSRIGDERVQRQSEMLRLERLVEKLASRVTQLERQQLRSSRLPAITIAEAEAAVVFSQSRLHESEVAFQQGKATESEVAGDRLSLVRAQGQLELATSAYQESLIVLELELVYAERQLLDARREKKLTERLAARGHTSSDALHPLLLNEKLAEKQVQMVKLHLETHRRAAGESIGSDKKMDQLKNAPSAEVDQLPETEEAIREESEEKGNPTELPSNQSEKQSEDPPPLAP